VIGTWSQRTLFILAIAVAGCGPGNESGSVEWSRWSEQLSAGLEEGQLAFHADGDRWSAVNRPGGFIARLGPRGAELEDGLSAREGVEPLRLGLRAWGRPDRMQRVEAVSPRSGRCRIPGRVGPRGSCIHSLELRHDGLVQWYDNRQEGLELGFDLPRAPEGPGPLRFELAVEGVDSAAGTDDRLLLARGGRARLLVHGLVARDARGRLLPSTLDWGGDGLVVLVDDLDATYPLEVDPYLSPVVAWSVSGGQSAAACGLSVAFAGDVDGDGYDDILVGVPGYDGEEFSEGAALLYPGGPAGPDPVASWLAGGDQAYAFFGASVAGAGDVNADGFKDLLVGGPGWSGDLPEQGIVRLFLGGPGGPSTEPSWERTGDWEGGLLGASVAGVGDLNGDHYGDVAAGAPGAAVPLVGDGVAMVFLGSAEGLASGGLDWTLEGLAQAEFGAALAGGGDVNGDGYDDLLVGSPGWSNPEVDEGATWLFLGSPSGPPLGAAWTFESDVQDARAGAALSAAGDFDSDGFADLVVGAPGLSAPLPAEGGAWVFSGSSTGPAAIASWSFSSGEDGALAGAALAAVGDLDGDGYEDLAVGAPAGDGEDVVDLGQLLIFTGGAAGLSIAPVVTRSGSTAGGWFGAAVAKAGDANGDGLADVLVGEPFADLSLVGQVQLLTGLPAWIDQDDDGYCSGFNCIGGLDPGDCDDLDPDRHPGAIELCNGVDDDCDGVMGVGELDVDGDGFLLCEGDCDDQDPGTNPSQAEECDGVDNDCDGVIDDGAEPLFWWPDNDEDGWGNPNFDPVAACLPFPGWTDLPGDCDDSLPEVNPGMNEVSCNGQDDDCDPATPDTHDLDGDEHIDCPCGEVFQEDCGDCDDANRLVHRGLSETCGDGIDQDCDGEDADCDTVNPCEDPSNVCRDYDCDCAAAGRLQPGLVLLLWLAVPLLRRRR
jgi:hypothetical protein